VGKDPSEPITPINPVFERSLTWSFAAKESGLLHINGFSDFCTLRNSIASTYASGPSFVSIKCSPSELVKIFVPNLNLSRDFSKFVTYF